MYPSIKTLQTICDSREQATKLRRIIDHTLVIPSSYDGDFLESIRSQYPVTQAWLRSCYHWPSRHHIRMTLADECLKTCGVEYIPAGTGSKSPVIEYCNTGDPYASTLIFVRGRYRVGCWGDIVERGNYA